MMLFRGSVKEVLLFYAIALLLSLIMTSWSVSHNVKAIEGGENPETAINLFLYVIAFTVLFLLVIWVIRRYLSLLVFLLELFFLWVTSTLLFYIISPFASIVWPPFLLILRTIFRENDTIRNLSVAIIGGVSAGILGASLTTAVALLFYIILVVYDFLSVFVTGHMVKMAHYLTGGNIDSGKSVSRRVVALGAGDLVLPAIFATTLPFPHNIISSLAALIGILVAFKMVDKFRRPLPALPYISAVQIPITALSLSLSTLLL